MRMRINETSAGGNHQRHEAQKLCRDALEGSASSFETEILFAPGFLIVCGG